MRPISDVIDHLFNLMLCWTCKFFTRRRRRDNKTHFRIKRDIEFLTFCLHDFCRNLLELLSLEPLHQCGKDGVVGKHGTEGHRRQPQRFDLID